MRHVIIMCHTLCAELALHHRLKRIALVLSQYNRLYAMQHYSIRAGRRPSSTNIPISCAADLECQGLLRVLLLSLKYLLSEFTLRLTIYTLGSIHDTRNGGCVLCPNPDLSGTNNHGSAGGQCRGSLHIVRPLLRCLLQFRQPVLTVPLHATDVLGQGTPRICRA